MTGEINVSECGNEIRYNTGGDLVDVAIGKSLWIIMTRDQATALFQALGEKILKEDNTNGR
ncbi:MAG: hypothetical protein GXY34_00305 [Syntrophomonadaceae bacterium]|nr:hypothetical protein [Syntrophomonadaceae bacterium]